VRVDVLCPSRSGLRLIRRYDPSGSLRLIWTPSSLKDGLFDVPPRRLTQWLYWWLYARYPVLVTTETTSTRLRRFPGFRSKLVRIRHGAGDAATRLDDPRIAQFDLTLVAGDKDKERLVTAGHVTSENCVVTGYAKFELIREPERLFDNEKPVGLYNAHLRPDLSSWFTMGQALVRAMEKISDWNFVVAPHVKLRGRPPVSSLASNILIDPGSIRSIDMTYTQVASVYIGDASSQVYEFLQRPRPCIFINAHGFDWRNDAGFAHFHLGQVIERPEDLAEALSKAGALQERYEPLQRRAVVYSLGNTGPEASRMQADAILALARSNDRQE
jgi:hypothetical protein